MHVPERRLSTHRAVAHAGPHCQTQMPCREALLWHLAVCKFEQLQLLLPCLPTDPLTSASI